MTIQELLKDDFFNLPLKQPKNKSFDKFIEEFLNTFLEKVNLLDSGFQTFGTQFIKNTQEKIVKGLIKSIKEYYNGNPYKAYKELDKTLRNDLKDLYVIIKQKTYSENENFYRIRLKKENYDLNRKDLFHIPFELRGKVTSQRYSIPGFPSLYLARTIYVCWEELNRPKIDDFQVMRLESTKPIKFLDLTPPTDNPELLTRELYRYFMTFPLVACCSVKAKNSSDTFKPEYIIPQLLLQWVRNNDRLDGIKYKSTHINANLYKKEGKLSNLVLPVKQNKNSGHCNKLKSMFKMTEVTSWQLYQFAVGGMIFMRNSEENKLIDDKLPKIEFVKGRKHPYSYSVIGKLEQYTDEMNTNRMK
jgi:hypothetical protein|tara:strand:- start:2155 stop:3231 length:1077 start_codon:yes stop_codon:yes gene_type:complete